MEHKEYLRLLFNHLNKDKGYGVFQQLEKYSYNFYTYSLLDANHFKKGLPVNPLQLQISSEEKFVQLIEQNPQALIHFKKDDLTEYMCFVDIFKKSDFFAQGCLLKNINKWTSFPWKQNLIKLIDSISITKQDVVDNIFRIPPKDLDAKSVNLFKLNELLTKRELTEKELDNFYLRFFRERKTQLKDAVVAEKYKDFLLTRYGGDTSKIKPYMGFLNSVINDYDDIQINFNNLNQNQLNMYIKNFMAIREKAASSELIIEDTQNPLTVSEKKGKNPRSHKPL